MCAVHVYMCAHMYRSPRLMNQVPFLISLSLIYRAKVFQLYSELVDFLCLASQLALIRPCLCLLYNGIISRPLESSIYSGVGDLNAGLHRFVTSAFSHRAISLSLFGRGLK